MHPRNIYKTPPNFTELASKYPDFLKISTLDLNGTVRINFKDLNSLRTLTKCLLHSDFGLDVDIPTDRLIPTVPLRLNYLLWVEDLLNLVNRKDDIFGIDIGTGACCIYPLMAAKKFNWKMLATEIDSKNFTMANSNVTQNKLDDFITVKMISSDSHLLLDCFSEFGGSLKVADFCMCNPPFYSSTDDIDCARSASRPPPRNARSGSISEIVTDGGEEHFVRRLINDSIKLREKVRVYTTMLGHKNSLMPLIHALEAYGIKSITHTTFRQGKTTRWGLAWSFTDSIDSPAVSRSPSKINGNKPLYFAIPPIDGVEYDVKTITAKILNILHRINIKTNTVQQKEFITTMKISASQNTWSHQRRKRRQLKFNCPDVREEKNCNGTHNIENSSDVPCKKIKLDPEIMVNDNTPCPKHSATDKINNNKEENNGCDILPKSGVDKPEENFLNAALCIRKDEEYLLLQLGYLSGSAGRDGIHQIVQYIKNNWK